MIFLLGVSVLCRAQDTWYGEIAPFGGGGTNDIFRFEELEGAASFTGTGMWTAGIDLRRIFTDLFSLETGAAYSHQYYYSTPAPGIEGGDQSGSFGLITVPVTARFDFLRWLFAEAGAVVSFQAGSSAADEMSGLGATAGLGFQYNFKSDYFIRVRAYGSQYALLHFMPEDNPQTLWNSGVTVGFGYQFIHLGKCNCPESNAPRRRFY
ncbi:MAG: outer membrane beta-barrel protein [Bacteroidales bacterium]|nr:outer membrane beta-barrel protein [Bacteroidales bacterium]